MEERINRSFKIKKHIPEIAIIAPLITVSLCAIFSLDITKATTYINQYDDTIKLFGSDIYKADSNFKAPETRLEG